MRPATDTHIIARIDCRLALTAISIGAGSQTRSDAKDETM
jgi:hypothetical protein